MLFLEGRCPHCREKRGFKVFSISEYTAEGRVEDIKRIQINEPTFSLPSRIKKAGFFAAGYCVDCKRPVDLPPKN